MAGLYHRTMYLFSRQSIQIGSTDFTEEEVRRIVEEIGNQFRGDRYHLMNNNCKLTEHCFERVFGIQKKLIFFSLPKAITLPVL